MATGNLPKTKAEDVYDNELGKTQSELNKRLTTNATETGTDLKTNYTDTEVTMQADGLLYLRNDAGETGYVIVHSSNSNNTMLLGGVQGYFMLPIRKGMKLTCKGSPHGCVFYPFKY